MDLIVRYLIKNYFTHSTDLFIITDLIVFKDIITNNKYIFLLFILFVVAFFCFLIVIVGRRVFG